LGAEKPQKPKKPPERRFFFIFLAAFLFGKLPASYLSISLIQIRSSSRGRGFVWTSGFFATLTST
jgi:hypothetical protein